MSEAAYPDEPDRAPGCPAPRESYDLFGHENAERAFADACETGRVHHAWMLSGPRGIGKATLAYRMARRLLGARADTAHGLLGADPQDPVCQRIAACSHGNLLVLRRPYDERGKRWRAQITVDEARRLPGFFERTAAEGGWRVCIIDAADEMNTSAANAILKILEEPPQRAMLVLVAHAPGRLPATIRSRCRQLQLRPLEQGACRALALSLGANEKDAELAARLSGGSPARALAIAKANGAALWRDIDRLVRHGASGDEAYALARRFSPLKAAPQRKLFLDLLALRLEQEIRARADKADLSGLEAWFSLREDLSSLASDMERLYLDPGQVVFNAVQSVTRTVSRQHARA